MIDVSGDGGTASGGGGLLVVSFWIRRARILADLRAEQSASFQLQVAASSKFLKIVEERDEIKQNKNV